MFGGLLGQNPEFRPEISEMRRSTNVSYRCSYILIRISNTK